MPKPQRPGLHQKGPRAPAAPNPFELRDQRKKHDILGRKSKGDKNKAGQARAAGIALRQKTLGIELQQQGKANLFADRRFAEADESMPEEEKMLLRFQRERQKSLFKKSIFNLQDEETTLTHRGQALSSMKTFEDDYAASDGEEELGEIDEQTVNAAHFGGFEPKKAADEEEGEERMKSKKEVMEELIAKSKHYRAERAKEKEEHSQLKERLDEEYREIADLLKGSGAEKPKLPPPGTRDKYDVIVRELAFDMKARPTDRTKTPDEIAREERDRLELLEKQRLMRMSDIDHAANDGGAPGGDDLDEGYFEAVEQARQEELGAASEAIRKKQTVALPFPTKGTAASAGSIDDLPFTITAPTTVEEMNALTSKRSARDLHTIFNRVLVCTHPSLAAGNKDKLKVFFGFLLDYMLSATGKLSEEHVNAAYHALLTLAQALPDIAAEQTRFKLDSFQQALSATLTGNDTKAWSHMPFVSILQFIANVYPVTDFQHSIVTPATLLAGQFLAQYPFRELADVSAALFVSSVLLTYLKPSSRYFPEVLAFLANSIFAFHAPPVTANPAQYAELDLRLAKPGAQQQAKAALLQTALELVLEYAALYEGTDAFTEAFAPILRSLHEVSNVVDTRPELKELHKRTLATVTKASKTATARRTPLQKLIRKPVALKSFNPKYEEKFDPTASYDPDKERVHLQKLKAKVKREQKGAIRELKKDAAFIQAEKEKKRREQKKEVAERLKRAVSGLSAQEQDVNLLKQEAKRKKARMDRQKK